MKEKVWNNATASSIMVKTKPNALMVNTRKMSPIVKMYAKSMFSIKSKGPAKSNEKVVASAPVDCLATENDSDLLPELLRSVEFSLDESIIPAQEKSKRSHKYTKSEGSAKSMAMVESKRSIMSNGDDDASAALVQVDISTKLASEKTPKMSLSGKHSQLFKTPSMMEKVWNNDTPPSMVKTKPNAHMVNTRKMSPIVKMSAKSMAMGKSEGPAKSNEEDVSSAPVNWLSRGNERDSWTIEDKCHIESAMSNKTNMNTNSSTLKRSLKSTKSEDSTKIMAMVESSGLVMSNEDDVASAALVGLAEEKVLPDERIHDELKNIKQYIQELSLQQNLLLQTFVHQEQSQMTAESPSRMSSVALEQQREQLNQQLQSVSPSHLGEGVSSSSSSSPSHLGEGCSLLLNDEMEWSSFPPIQSDSSSYLGDCSFTLNEEGVEVDCYDCGSVFFGCLR